MALKKSIEPCRHPTIDVMVFDVFYWIHVTLNTIKITIYNGWMLFIWDTCMVSHDADIRAAVELFLWSQAHTSLASDGILTPRVTCEQRHEDIMIWKGFPHCCRLFHIPLAQPGNGRHLIGQCKGLYWLRSEKRWEFPLVTWAHNAMGH